MTKTRARIPVIDLFAGPGGLGEGFSCLRAGSPSGEPCFEIRLSIEKDPLAHRTLELRSLFRTFEGHVPDAYYDYLRGEITREELFAIPALAGNVDRARHEAWNMTLALENHAAVSRRVKDAIGGSATWVLIGGPPCQAYSLVGRSRMRADGIERFEADARHFLYRKYLQITAAPAPPVFIMENVKGLISATHSGSRMFERIVSDLSRPGGGGHRYRIVPLQGSQDLLGASPSEFIVRAEQFGVPQARHRVILVGIRADISGTPLPPKLQQAATVEEVFSGLPRIRSRLSKEEDNQSAWLDALETARREVRSSEITGARKVAEVMGENLRWARLIDDTGAGFTSVRYPKSQMSGPKADLGRWLADPALGGVTGHSTRSHMRDDIKRYFFAAAFAKAFGISPKIRDFPRALLPRHRNALAGDDSIPFEDRFRVQLADHPSTTIVSHISKDGHYYIHPDPAQCRSLTLREAARLQTFPDNYHFEGNRTQQFVQVGNAVPPYLAAKIAQSVHAVLSDSTVDVQ